MNNVSSSNSKNSEHKVSEDAVEKKGVQDSASYNEEQATKAISQEENSFSTNKCIEDNNSSGILYEDIPSDIITEVYSSYLDRINKQNFFVADKKELLEIVLQYNELLDKIEVLNSKLEIIKNDELQANLLYDDFKRAFAGIIEDCPWLEKLFYVLPLFEDYEENDVWINQWCQTIQSAITGENLKNLRNYINRNLYSAVFSLPKDVYCYKVKSSEVNGVSDDALKFIYLFASKTAIYIKNIKDFSDQLRSSLQKVLLTEPIQSTLGYGRIAIIPKDEINADIELIRTLLEEGKEDDAVYDIIDKYKLNSIEIARVLDKQEEFINFARKTYQDVLNFQNVLNSVRKQVYTLSLLDIYKLYDSVVKSLHDLGILKVSIIKIDEKSQLFIERLIAVIEKFQSLIEKYLKESFNIRPLKSIQEGVNFNDIDINWYEVLVATDAPSQELVECISSISDTGFAKYNIDEEIDFVVRPARISVYNKKVVNFVLTEQNNE